MMPPNKAEQIEQALGVTLPQSYATVLTTYPLPERDAMLLDEVDEIISLTKEYRDGFGDAAPWPKQLVYIGDSDDACPSALDTTNGIIVKLDHGDIRSPPLQQWSSIDEYVDDLSLLFD